MASNQAAYGGSVGGGFRLVLESHEVQVDVANNRSLIEITQYMTNVANEGNVYNDAATPWSLGGTESASGSFAYNFNPNGTYYMLNNNQYWISHNSSGDASVSLSASHNAENSPYLTSAATSLSYNLTHINRYATITSMTTPNITDVSYQIAVATDVTCDLFGYSTDGGATFTDVSATGTSHTFDIGGNLPSSTTYTIATRVRRQDSGLTTTSSAQTVTTLSQGGFFVFF